MLYLHLVGEMLINGFNNLIKRVTASLNNDYNMRILHPTLLYMFMMVMLLLFSKYLKRLYFIYSDWCARSTCVQGFSCVTCNLARISGYSGDWYTDVRRISVLHITGSHSTGPDERGLGLRGWSVWQMLPWRLPRFFQFRAQVLSWATFLKKYWYTG